MDADFDGGKRAMEIGFHGRFVSSLYMDGLDAGDECADFPASDCDVSRIIRGVAGNFSKNLRAN
jgi:hypothetical protein